MGDKFTCWVFAFILLETLINLNDQHQVQGFQYYKDAYRCPKMPKDHWPMMTFRDKCYRFVSIDRNWEHAQLDCQQHGGNLVHIKDRATQDFIWRATKVELKWDVNGMWIGAHDLRFGDNKWEWVRGNHWSQGDTIVWSNWDAGEPKCGWPKWLACVELCGQYRFDEGGRWHDYRCDMNPITNYRYCCMYDMAPPTTTTRRPTTTRRTTTTTARPTTTTTARPTTTTTARPTTTTTTRPTTTTTTAMPITNKTITTSTARTKPNNSGGSLSTRITPPGVDGQTSASISAGQSSSNTGSSGGDGALIAAVAVGSLGVLCLILLLLFFIRRREQKKQPDDAPYQQYPNATYTGGWGLPGHPNPQSDSCSAYPVTSRPTLCANFENPYSENEHNSCAEAMGDDERYEEDGKGIYDDIPFDMPSDMSDSDDDCTGATALNTTAERVEYLHARAPTRTDVEPTEDKFNPNKQTAAVDNVYGPHPMAEEPGVSFA